MTTRRQFLNGCSTVAIAALLPKIVVAAPEVRFRQCWDFGSEQSATAISLWRDGRYVHAVGYTNDDPPPQEWIDRRIAEVAANFDQLSREG